MSQTSHCSKKGCEARENKNESDGLPLSSGKMAINGFRPSPTLER